MNFIVWPCTLLLAKVSSRPIVDIRPTISNATGSLTDRPHLSRKADVIDGEPPLARAVLIVTAIVSTSLMGGLLGYRVKNLYRHRYKSLSLTQIYVLVLCLSAMAFQTSSAVIVCGLGLATRDSCKAAILLCLTFYSSNKLIMYFFLVERAHVLRAPYKRRYHDRLWLLSMIGIGTGLGAVSIAGCMSPVFSLSPLDATCRIGLKRYISVPLLSLDVLINIYLTLVFIYLMSPLVESPSLLRGVSFTTRFTHWIGDLSGRSKGKGSVDLHRSNQQMAQKVDNLLWKTLVGCVLVILPTTANLTAICVLQGKEWASVCLAVCALDITWAVSVVHWLTLPGDEENEKTSTKLVAGAASTGPILEGHAL
ncbi:hypothetical protein EJ02DRAFT_334856 [Clathrospora elynae]|uniref:G-protein coupled receptors family 1 profile domain-containing protein n=1 Tax=Clathrospora elynae TaxID=706981 RepID=A0A6A5T3F2_9PLEO|nr:hypothetical protein EJ02DRAFT_334856 [Clathrospora elynae]